MEQPQPRRIQIQICAVYTSSPPLHNGYEITVILDPFPWPGREEGAGAPLKSGEADSGAESGLPPAQTDPPGSVSGGSYASGDNI